MTLQQVLPELCKWPFTCLSSLSGRDIIFTFNLSLDGRDLEVKTFLAITQDFSRFFSGHHVSHRVLYPPRLQIANTLLAAVGYIENQQTDVQVFLVPNLEFSPPLGICLGKCPRRGVIFLNTKKKNKTFAVLKCYRSAFILTFTL